jgi:DNA topoisomerase III
MERRMVQVCEGQKTKAQVLAETVEQYKDIYIRAKAEFGKVLEVSRRSSANC